jgi:hypothetical protein
MPGRKTESLIVVIKEVGMEANTEKCRQMPLLQSKILT